MKKQRRAVIRRMMGVLIRTYIFKLRVKCITMLVMLYMVPRNQATVDYITGLICEGRDLDAERIECMTELERLYDGNVPGTRA